MFNDLTVLELASVLAGPSVGQFFAELGATVIKVENIHTGGDVTRTWKVDGENTDDRSSYFCAVNWGKKSIAVDLSRKEGREIVHQLVRKTDVVIASYKSGDAKKLGVDYQTLSSLNNQLIYGQITGFGPDNPRVGYDAVIQAEAGFMFMNGESNGPSLKMPVALMDILAAHHLKEGILLALLQKSKTGKGDFVEVSLLQAAVASLANQASNWLVAGVIPKKQGSAHPNIAPYGDIFKTSDGHEIILAVGSDRQFTSLCQILRFADAEVDDDFKTNEARVKNRQSLNQLLQRGMEQFDVATLVAAMDSANIPYGIVKNVRDALEVREVQHMLLRSGDRTGVRTYVGSNFTDRSSHILPPPHLGEHSRQILIQSLELTHEAVKSLSDLGVIK